MLIFRSLQTYMIDVYERNAASAIAANVVVRSICGAVFPIFASAARFPLLGADEITDLTQHRTYVSRLGSSMGLHSTSGAHAPAGSDSVRV